MWKRCSFSGNAQYIVAGTTRQHSLYIWDKASGSLVKMLTGQKGETLLDVVVGIKWDTHMHSFLKWALH